MGLTPAEDICKYVVHTSDRIEGIAVRRVVQRSENLDGVPAMPLLGRDPKEPKKEPKARTGTDVCTPMCIAAL